MKLIYIFAFSLVVACSGQTYTTENDDLNIEAVVADTPTLQAFAGCFNDKVECDEKSGDFKKDIAEAIREACEKCTDAQKHIFKVFLAGLKEKLPADYAALKAKYDPDNKYFSNLEKAIANA